MAMAVRAKGKLKTTREYLAAKKAKKGELPWIVRLDTATKSGQMCTGTILNSEFILTAGHCYKPDFISASVYEYQNVEQSRTRKEVYQHPDYKVGSDDVNAFYGPNLALIQLNRPLEWNEWTAPACLPPIDRVVEGGTNITIAGHGAIANDINGIDKTFDYPDMPHIGNTMVSHGIHCDYPNLTEAFCSPNKFRYPDGPDPNKFFFTSACAGDSGGPALHRATMDDGTERWEVYGVVSTTESKLCTAATTYYMLVPHVREWIFDTIVNKGTIAY